MSFAYKFVEKEVAKDIVQDTFFKLWDTPEKFSDTTDIRFYLYTLVRNQCLNYIRNKKVEDKYRNKTELYTDDFFSNAILEEELFICLQKAIENLPKKYQQVIHMHLEGLKDKDIAEQLNITVDSVKTKKKRGRELLKDNIRHPLLVIIINLAISAH